MNWKFSVRLIAYNWQSQPHLVQSFRNRKQHQPNLSIDLSPYKMHEIIFHYYLKWIYYVIYKLDLIQKLMIHTLCN